MIDKEQIISDILKLEYEITVAVINGHIPNEDDKFKEHRISLKKFRELIK